MSHAVVLVVGDDVAGQMNRWSNHANDLSGKWDWYVVGGRWDGELILHDGSTANKALVRQVDWGAMDDREVVRRERARQRSKEYEAKHGRPDPFFEDKPARKWTPWAVLIDGDWRETGELGMFGLAINEDEEGFYEGFQPFRNSLGPTRQLTIVDYHQ